LDPPHPARMFSANPPVRPIRGVARNYPAPSRRSPEKAGPFRRAAPDPISRLAEALRIYPDAEGSRSLSDYHVDRALGQYPHGRLARATAAARTQELQEDVRHGHGLLGMRRVADSQGRSRSSRTRRAKVLAATCGGLEPTLGLSLLDCGTSALGPYPL